MVRPVHPLPRGELRFGALRRLLQRIPVLRRQQPPRATPAALELLVRLLQGIHRGVQEAPELDAAAHDHSAPVSGAHAVVGDNHGDFADAGARREGFDERVLPEELQIVVEDEHLRRIGRGGAGAAGVWVWVWVMGVKTWGGTWTGGGGGGFPARNRRRRSAPTSWR